MGATVGKSIVRRTDGQRFKYLDKWPTYMRSFAVAYLESMVAEGHGKKKIEDLPDSGLVKCYGFLEQTTGRMIEKGTLATEDVELRFFLYDELLRRLNAAKSTKKKGGEAWRVSGR